MTNGHTNGNTRAPFGRLLTAMVTPFDDAGEVDYKQAQRLARAIVDGGSDGLVITGTTGEAPTLSHDEKLELYRAAVEAVGADAAVIAGTGTYNTRESIENSLAAERAGAQGLLLSVPYYNKPSQEGMFQHFKAIAGAVSLPCIMYNIPGRTSVNMAPETIVRAAHEIANVIGVKEASGNLEAMASIVEDAGPDFYVWSGDDSMTLPLMSVGGYGVICTCSNMVARKMRAIIDTFVAGRVVEAAALHRQLLPLMTALMTVAANPVPIKHAMNRAGFKVGGVRQPLWALDDASSAKLMSVVEKYAVDLPVSV